LVRPAARRDALRTSGARGRRARVCVRARLRKRASERLRERARARGMPEERDRGLCSERWGRGARARACASRLESSVLCWMCTDQVARRGEMMGLVSVVWRARARERAPLLCAPARRAPVVGSRRRRPPSRTLHLAALSPSASPVIPSSLADPRPSFASVSLHANAQNTHPHAERETALDKPFLQESPLFPPSRRRALSSGRQPRSNRRLPPVARESARQELPAGLPTGTFSVVLCEREARGSNVALLLWERDRVGAAFCPLLSSTETDLRPPAATRRASAPVRSRAPAASEGETGRRAPGGGNGATR